MHNWHCTDCGKAIHTSDKNEDMTFGRCPECWAALGEFWIVEYASAYGASILRAAHDDDSRLTPEARLYSLVGRGSNTDLTYLSVWDMPDRPMDGMVPGCNNKCWIISDEEAEALRQINRERALDSAKAVEALLVAGRRSQLAEDAERATYTVIEEYTLIMPGKGEAGRDGYWDVLVESGSGVKTRVIVRNVFDFGQYGYPARVKGTGGVRDNSNWTNEERDAVKWANRFAPFGGLRM